ncbi:PAS domain-containing protein [Lichenibacterium dinghuense]|uniref:PAS domain-containing protein n=1 Tax=Lichenibacterium dinghuense TaxID=2895977 RepID=UPI001F38E634|nr:PAS domain-containing protein [Lichenibacterium sp. 6Y81]
MTPERPAFPHAGGTTAAEMRAFDWSRTRIGPPDTWPAALRTAVDLILDSPESMYLAWGPELHFFFNDAYRPVLGPRLPVALGTTLPELWPDAWPAVRPFALDALAGRASRHVDMPVVMARRGEPERTWWTFSYSPLRDRDGAVRGLLCITNETTDHVLATRAQREREAELRLVTDALPVLIAFVDRDLTYRYANRAYQDWFGLCPEGMIGRSVRDIVDAPSFELRRGAFERALAGVPARLELDWPHPDGRRRVADLRYLPRLTDDGLVDGLYICAVDVTDRKDAEALLRDANDRLERAVAERTRDLARSEARFRATFDASPEMLLVLRCRPDGRFEYVDANAATLRLYGLERAAVVGRRPAEIVDAAMAEAIEQRSRDCLRTGETQRYEALRDYGSGARLAISVAVAPIGPDADGDPLVLFCARDVTEHRAAEEALRQSQKMEAVGQLTGGVAHDFNNLLTVIRSSVDLLKRPNLPEERRRRYVEAIADTAGRAARLTGQLLAFARRQPLQPEVFDAVESVSALREMLRTLTGSRIRIDLGAPDHPCFVSADPSQFDTALVNLAVNARDAMDGQGTLAIAVGVRGEVPALRGHPAVPGEVVTVSLSDTGSGIAPSDLDRIFEPFFTTKGVGQGTGLGLSQVFGFAKQSGGDIGVESAPGRGTTFTLFLPRVGAAGRRAADAQPGAGPVEGHGTRVLVVEDNAEVGAFAVGTLTELGYRPVLVADAAAGLDALERDPDGFDAVFSDVVMPGMDGVSFARLVAARHPGLPVLLTSGYSHVLAQEGTSGFELLRKPYSVEALSRALWTAARRRR